MNLLEELQWRGLLHQNTPGLQELLAKENIGAYVGFDPTADSLHIGSLVPIMLLVHLQRHGHTPIALVGGATAMVGDPSGKSDERNLMDLDTIKHNSAGVEAQLRKFLNFDGDNAAKISAAFPRIANTSLFVAPPTEVVPPPIVWSLNLQEMQKVSSTPGAKSSTSPGYSAPQFPKIC